MLYEWRVRRALALVERETKRRNNRVVRIFLYDNPSHPGVFRVHHIEAGCVVRIRGELLP